MKPNTFYFTHDFTARNDEKIKLLLMKWGMTGYGVYWSIVEDLYQNANAMRTHTERIAYELRVPENMVQSILHDFNLFVFDGDFFGSMSVQRRMDERLQKSASARESAFKRWEKMRTHSESDANALQPECEGNAIKERKGKENKRKEIKKENKLKEKKIVQAEPDGLADIDLKENIVLNGKISPQAHENDAVGTPIPTEVKSSLKTKENHYSVFVEDYKKFIEGRGLAFRFSAVDGKHLKQIISYLENLPSSQNKEPIELFRFILNNWEHLGSWLKTQTQIRQINSQLPNIIETLKQHYNGKDNKTQRHNSVSSLAAALRERIEKGSSV